MSARRPRFWILALLCIAGASALPAAPAHANPPYSLRVKLSKADHGRGLDISMPWILSHGGSPFDFTSGNDDGPDLEGLREAWSVLGRLPEGRSVTITSDRKRIRGYRHAGSLVLEPLGEANDRDVRIRVPGEIVEAILRRDGRLTNDDLASLLRTRREIALVDVDSQDGRIEVWINREADRDAQ